MVISCIIPVKANTRIFNGEELWSAKNVIELRFCWFFVHILRYFYIFFRVAIANACKNINVNVLEHNNYNFDCIKKAQREGNFLSEYHFYGF